MLFVGALSAVIFILALFHPSSLPNVLRSLWFLILMPSDMFLHSLVPATTLRLELWMSLVCSVSKSSCLVLECN